MLFLHLTCRSLPARLKANCLDDVARLRLYCLDDCLLTVWTTARLGLVMVKRGYTGRWSAGSPVIHHPVWFRQCEHGPSWDWLRIDDQGSCRVGAGRLRPSFLPRIASFCGLVENLLVAGGEKRKGLNRDYADLGIKYDLGV